MESAVGQAVDVPSPDIFGRVGRGDKSPLSGPGPEFHLLREREKERDKSEDNKWDEQEPNKTKLCLVVSVSRSQKLNASNILAGHRFCHVELLSHRGKRIRHERPWASYHMAPP